MTDFVHLHVHSEYSLREGTLRLSQLLERVRQYQSPAVAVTDRNGMYGLVKFYQAAKAAGVKPILGVQLAVCEDKQLEEVALGRVNGPPTDSVVLLAETLEGYRNLVRLTSLAGERLRFPVVTLSEMARHTQDVILLMGGGESHIARQFALNDEAEAHRWLHHWLDTWPRSHLYLEVQNHGVAQERQALAAEIQWAGEHGVPLVATNDCHYLDEGDADVQRLVAEIDSNLWNRPLQGNRYDLASPGEMERRLGQIPGALENTLEIAQRCNVELPLGEVHQPLYPLSGGESAAQVLTRAATVGAGQRYGKMSPELSRRLEYELSVINRMGFADYFLVVADFIRYAHKQGISTGPGRGSAAGSLVAYALRITDVDPIANKLLFERFLNPERVSWPDIDTDFEYERRNEVIQYVVNRYGKTHVAQIGTFGTLAAKAAIRDMGRALKAPPRLVDKLAKLVPGWPVTTLQRAYEEVAEIPELLRAQPELQRLWRFAQAVEGLPRHTSIHAAGVVISPFPLADLVPVQAGADGVPVTQYPMEDVERLGLIKMDFLGLRTLTLIDNAVRSVAQRTGRALDWRRIAVTDKATFQMLCRGETEGCFQLESAGMKRVLRDLRPTGWEDLIAVISLYRPGPMENIPSFIQAKHGRIPVPYPHPDLKPILQDTYGVIVYQEQIMQIAATMAGFTLGQADILRRAVSKKKREVLDEQRFAFVTGCRKKGYDEELANDVYNLIVRFANYGFNRCHAAAYAVLAYRTAWLRANYLPDFLAALLSLTMGNADKEKEYKRDAGRHNIQVLPPSIQRSRRLYVVESDKAIRSGLLAVRNVGHSAVDAILEARRDAEFSSLVDFLQRVNSRTCNRKTVESLLEAGALDDFLPQPSSDESKLTMLEEAYRQLEEGRLTGGLGLQFVQGDGGREQAGNGPGVPNNREGALYIRYGAAISPGASGEQWANSLEQVKQLLLDSPGQVRVVLYDEQRSKTRLLPKGLSVAVTPELIAALEERVGLGNVRMGVLPTARQRNGLA